MQPSEANKIDEQTAEKMQAEIEALKATAEKSTLLINRVRHQLARMQSKTERLNSIFVTDTEQTYEEIRQRYRSLHIRVMITNEVSIYAIAHGMPHIARVMLSKFDQRFEWWQNKIEWTIEQWIDHIKEELRNS